MYICCISRVYQGLIASKKNLMYFSSCVIGICTPEKNINWMILHLPPKFTCIGIITIIPYQKNPNTHPKSKISKIDAFKKSVPFKWLRNLIDNTLKLPGVQLLQKNGYGIKSRSLLFLAAHRSRVIG